jgi:hypothetical protein
MIESKGEGSLKGDGLDVVQAYQFNPSHYSKDSMQAH